LRMTLTPLDNCHSVIPVTGLVAVLTIAPGVGIVSMSGTVSEPSTYAVSVRAGAAAMAAASFASVGIVIGDPGRASADALVRLPLPTSERLLAARPWLTHDDARALQLHRRDFMATPRVRPMGIGYELMGIRRNGESFPVEIGLSPVSTTEIGIVAIASIRDISETRRAQQALARARRDNFLAQIGRLALESPDYELAIRRILELVAAALEVPAVAIFSTGWHGSGLGVRATTGLHGHAAQAIATIFGEADFVHDSFGKGSRHVITADLLREAEADILERLRRQNLHGKVPAVGN